MKKLLQLSDKNKPITYQSLLIRPLIFIIRIAVIAACLIVINASLLRAQPVIGTTTFDGENVNIAPFGPLPRSGTVDGWSFFVNGTGSGSINHNGANDPSNVNTFVQVASTINIGSDDDSEFDFENFVVQFFSFAGTYTITAYKDGSPIGSTNATASDTYGTVDLSSNTDFDNIDEIRLSGFGGSDVTLNIDEITISAATSISIPTVSTTAETGVGSTSATLGGNVTADGGATVSERGIVWDTSTGPDIDKDNVISIGSGTGSFSQSVGLLPFGTTIFYRAYATNSEGTAYGTEESFTTTSTVSVNLTGAEGWRLLSVPDDVDLSTFLGPIWTQGVTLGGDTDAGTPNVYTWSTSIDGNDQADWQAVTDLNSTTLAGGQGVLVQVYADPDYDGATAPGFPQTLSVTGSEFASGVSPTMNTNTTGWTVLGNPFASAVTYSDLSPTNLAGTVYTWDPNDDGGDGGQAGQDTGSWKTYNGTSGDLTGGRIAPFQGFLVQNSTTGSSVSFTQSSKTATATTFLGKENSIPFVRLELEGRGMRNSTWMEFTSAGSTENTKGDAWELTPLSSNYALLATQKADGSLVDIGRYPEGDELEIPLVTEVTRSGHYSLNVTDFEAAGQTLFLNDLHTGESVRLNQGTRYEFTINQAAKAPADPFAILQNGLKKTTNETHRFVISSSALENPVSETPKQFTLEQNYPNPFNPATVIRYQLPVSSQVRLEVFDMAGRQVATLVNGQKEAGSHTVNFDGANLSSGVYMYRLRTEGRLFSKKLTLIK